MNLLEKRVMTVLRKHEKSLSDGFDYYLPAPDWEPEYEDMDPLEIKEDQLRLICSEIIEAVSSLTDIPKITRTTSETILMQTQWVDVSK
jgi:hypothetical protein